MSLTKICRICLRTNIDLRELKDNLSDFYEVLCDYVTDNTAIFSCSTCELNIKKCYNFKKHCCKAEKILRNWKKYKFHDKPPVHELHERLTPFDFLGNHNSSTKSVQDNFIVEGIKSESPTSVIEHQIDTKSEDDTKYDQYDQNFGHNDDHSAINNDDHVIDNNGDQIKINDDQNKLGDLNDDDDDKCLSELLNCKKVDKPKRIIKKKIGVTSNETGENVEKRGKDLPKLTRRRARKPLTNQKEYETVFDIQLFETEEDVLKEFEQRKSLERYTTAPYKCTICFTVYKCQKLLDFHMKWHDPSAGDCVCKVCHMRFKNYLSVQKHNNDVHFGLYKCKRCPLITYHRMVMVHHYQKHRGVEFKCKHCDGVYRHKSTYMTHLRVRHKSDHVCVTCARTFVSDVGLMVHRKKVHKTTTKYDIDGTALCNDCNITFATHAVYIVHVLTTPKHKDLAATIIGCPECGEEFEDKLEVRAHRRKLHPGYNYSAMKYAERNVLNGRNADDRVLECTLCGKSGTHNTWLYRHYNAEHPAAPYDLYNEKRKHLCDECGRSYFSLTALREHKNLHTGAKPYTCHKCPSKFRTKSCLNMHLERHLPPARECQHCGKKFASASNLSNHMRSHIGDRRYKCEICSKGFLHSAALREHVRGVHHHIRRSRKLPLKCMTD